MLKTRLAAAAAVLLTACSYEIRPTTYGATGVELLHDYPAKAEYTVLGTKGWSFYRPGFSEPGLADVWDDLSTRVRSMGGNACVVRYQKVSSLSGRSIDVTCEVLKVAKR